MAQFKVGATTFSVSADMLEAVLPRLSKQTLENSLLDLVELERCHEMGILICTKEAWDEIITLAKRMVFEIRWRDFATSCGIHLEVR